MGNPKLQSPNMSTIHVDPNTMDKILETQAVHHHTKSLLKRDPEDDYRLFLKQIYRKVSRTWFQ